MFPVEVCCLRKFMFPLLIFMVLSLSGCSLIGEKPDISEPVMSKYIDSYTSKPVGACTVFKQSDSTIYFTVKVTNFPKDTKLKAVWKYLSDGTEMPSEIIAEGTGYEAFSLKKSGTSFPAGSYEVTVSAVVDGRTLETKSSFQIMPEVKASHILNPVTAKSVDAEDTLNPSEVTSEFSQSDPVVYFIIQSKDLPKSTKVSCEWVYTPTGDVITHELAVDGSRNIAFDLKPDPGQKLPAGKYQVTASIETENGIESLAKEFEIK